MLLIIASGSYIKSQMS